MSETDRAPKSVFLANANNPFPPIFTSVLLPMRMSKLVPVGSKAKNPGKSRNYKITPHLLLGLVYLL
jgi:hypothetical protein